MVLNNEFHFTEQIKFLVPAYGPPGPQNAGEERGTNRKKPERKIVLGEKHDFSEKCTASREKYGFDWIRQDTMSYVKILC